MPYTFGKRGGAEVKLAARLQIGLLSSIFFATLTLTTFHAYADADADVAVVETNERNSLKSIVEKFLGLSSEVKKAGDGARCIPCEAKLAAEALDAQKALEPKLKSKTELLGYITCFETDPENRHAYFNYREYIKTAAQTFGVNEVFLTCLIMRESRFDKSRVSPAGAKGLAQLMPDTIDFVNTLASPNPKTQDELARLQKIADNDSGKVTLRDQRYAFSILNSFTLSNMWQTYLRALKSNGVAKSRISNLSGFTANDVANPKMAIGAAAIYARYIIDLLQNTLNSDGSVDTGSHETPHFKFLSTVGALYNRGHGLAARVLVGINPPTPAAWTQALGKGNDETARHITAIENCMEQGSMRPPPGSENLRCEIPMDGRRDRLSPPAGNNDSQKSTTAAPAPAAAAGAPTSAKPPVRAKETK
jgi:hypothetical protein